MVLDPYQLLGVFVQKRLPIIRWNYDIAVWCSCELGGIDVGRGIDISKVSQSSDLCSFVSA